MSQPKASHPRENAAVPTRAADSPQRKRAARNVRALSERHPIEVQPAAAPVLAEGSKESSDDAIDELCKQKRALRIPEIAGALGTRPKQVYRFIERRQLRAFRHGDFIRVRPKELRAFCERGAVGGKR